MHYEEAVFLQKLARKGDTSRSTLVDCFLDAYPYGAQVFGMTQEQYEHHIDKQSAKLLDDVKNRFGIVPYVNDNGD